MIWYDIASRTRKAKTKFLIAIHNDNFVFVLFFYINVMWSLKNFSNGQKNSHVKNIISEEKKIQITDSDVNKDTMDKK